MIFTCPCRQKIKLSRNAFYTGFVCSSCSKVFEPSTLMAHETKGPGHSDIASIASLDNGLVVKQGEVLDCFQIESELGRGSFGSVFLAKDLVLNRQVALKIPRVVHLDNAHVQLLFREAQLVAKLRHPNIVAVHEIRNSGGEIYIVSDFIDGITLKEMNSVVQFGLDEVVSLMVKLAHAAHYAHSRGVIHRDLKPANVLVDKFGEPYITDFGIAFHELSSEEGFHSNSQAVGTPAYMAPEQAFSGFAKPSAQLDVFALGVILFELLHGELPIEGRDLRLSTNRCSRDVPDQLQQICTKALAFDVGNRHSTAMELAEELEFFQENQLDGKLARQNPTPAPLQGMSVGLIKLSIAVLIGFILLATWIGFTAAPENAKPMAELDGVDLGRSSVRLQLKGSEKLLRSVDRIEIYKADVDIDYGLAKSKIVAECGPGGSLTKRLGQGSYRLGVFGAKGAMHFATRNIKDVASSPIKWKPLVLPPPIKTGEDEIELGPEQLVKIDEGTFEFGSEHYEDPRTQKLLYPFVRQTVKQFYVSKREVTVGNFQKVMGFIPDSMKACFPDGNVPADVPVTHVAFEMAEKYCEKIGARLPTLVEYVFLASNFGETKFPWGEHEPKVARCASGGCVIENDFLLQDPRIEGLYSSVLEWTTDINIPNTDGLNLAAKEMLREIACRSRVVVGGTLSEIRSGDADRIRGMKGVRAFGSIETENPGFHQGFRVYR